MLHVHVEMATTASRRSSGTRLRDHLRARSLREDFEGLLACRRVTIDTRVICFLPLPMASFSRNTCVAFRA
jgi:hypothetical protein